MRKTAVQVAAIASIALIAMTLIIAGTFAPDPDSRRAAWEALAGFATIVVAAGFFIFMAGL